ncbi:MAG: cupredoxin domain-containing protein [Candidatus Levybacteria bacterium]|nr:cupredoxin domain-containing protein [Candidatus Levybacteria bacterium]
MSEDKIIVAILGVLGIAFTYWFFLMKKDEEVAVEELVEIKVDGGYNPSTIAIPKGKTTKIIFFRTDPTDCLSEVVLSDFKIRRELPLNQKVTIEVTPQKSGEFPFSCGMGMFHGRIIVR